MLLLAAHFSFACCTDSLLAFGACTAIFLFQAPDVQYVLAL